MALAPLHQRFETRYCDGGDMQAVAAREATAWLRFDIRQCDPYIAKDRRKDEEDRKRLLGTLNGAGIIARRPSR